MSTERWERTKHILEEALRLSPDQRQTYLDLACGADRETLGVRVPRLELLAGVKWPVLQSSANRTGGPDPARLDEVPPLIRAASDLLIDGGELPGTPSTVVDLRDYEDRGEWSVVRQGAIAADELAASLQ